jgi:hypothetical protein
MIIILDPAIDDLPELPVRPRFHEPRPAHVYRCAQCGHVERDDQPGRLRDKARRHAGTHQEQEATT